MQNVINVVKFMIKMETQLFNKYCENSQVKIASHIYKYTSNLLSGNLLH